LETPEVGSWAEDKYRLVRFYADVFTKSMRGKWDSLVYIDLFAGAGRSKIEGTSYIVPSSPLLALDTSVKFSKYVFCEANTKKLQALTERVKTLHPDLDVEFIAGDSNSNVDIILKAIPQKGSVLSFCFVDPYMLENLKFQTLRKLSTKKMDFLILIPSFMDANRELKHYIQESNKRVEEFTGSLSWREDWNNALYKGAAFGPFVADLVGRQMAGMKYRYSGLDGMLLIKQPKKNSPMYHLAFFSKSDLADKFWKQAKKYCSDQPDLFN